MLCRLDYSDVENSMAQIENIWTSLDVEIKLICDCGEEISLSGLQDNQICSCGVKYSSFIGHNGSEHTAIVKQDGNEISQEIITF